MGGALECHEINNVSVALGLCCASTKTTMSSKFAKYVRTRFGRRKKHREPQVVRGLDRTRRDSAGSEGDRADGGERSFEMQPVVGEGEVGDTGDDELVVH